MFHGNAAVLIGLSTIVISAVAHSDEYEDCINKYRSRLALTHEQAEYFCREDSDSGGSRSGSESGSGRTAGVSGGASGGGIPNPNPCGPGAMCQPGVRYEAFGPHYAVPSPYSGDIGGWPNYNAAPYGSSGRPGYDNAAPWNGGGFPAGGGFMAPPAMPSNGGW